MSSRPPVRAIIWRWRRLLSAVFVALCLALVVSAIGSSGRVLPTELVVAARDLPAGHVMSESDVERIPAPSGIMSEDIVVDGVDGERLSIGITAGTPVTSSMFVGPTLSDSAPDGTVVIPIYLSSPPELTPVGSIVNLWGADEAGNAFMAASGVTIMAFSTSEGSSPFSSNDNETTYAYVAVENEQATFVLGMSTRTALLAVIDG